MALNTKTFSKQIQNSIESFKHIDSFKIQPNSKLLKFKKYLFAIYYSSKSHKYSINSEISYKYIIIALLVVFIDQLTKLLVRHYMQLEQSIPIIKDAFHLTYITNTGTFFGMFQGSQSNIFFIIFTIILLGGVIYVFNKLSCFEKAFFALVMGAALGNLIDRLVFSHVIDFLDLRFWPIFNIADSVLSISIIILVIYTIKEGLNGEDS